MNHTMLTFRSPHYGQISLYSLNTYSYVAVLGHRCELLHYTDSPSSLYRNKDFPLQAITFTYVLLTTFIRNILALDPDIKFDCMRQA